MPRKKTYTIESALDGAMELFSERGYHGTSMEAIAAHLKLSRSSVYFTFRAKSALFVQALRRHTGEERAARPGRVGELGGDRAGAAPQAAGDPGADRAGACRIPRLAPAAVWRGLRHPRRHQPRGAGAGSRYLKVTCQHPGCGYQVRLTRKWLALGTPRWPLVGHGNLALE